MWKMQECLTPASPRDTSRSTLLFLPPALILKFQPVELRRERKSKRETSQLLLEALAF